MLDFILQNLVRQFKSETMISMGRGLSVTVALVLLLVVEAALLVQTTLQIQGPLDKPNGLCATFVLSQGLGYNCEEYVVQTSDGFLLGVQRMYNGAVNSTAKKPVFLYHGILSFLRNGDRDGGKLSDPSHGKRDSWLLLNPPSKCLPFMLGEAGYDVWIGNSRTTNYSSGHVTFQRTDEGFWNWSLDELVTNDLPAMLGSVSSKTSTTIHYVGYSQGSQTAIASFSERQIVPLLDKVVLLAPVAYASSIKTILTIGADLFLIDELLLVGVYEFNPELPSGIEFMNRLCSSPDANCTDDVITAVTGPNCCMNYSRMSYYDAYAESTATKNIVHLAQQYRTQSFAKYDYGFWQNFQVYNSLFPPSYDVSAIPSMPLLLIHGGNDGLADVQDVAFLLQQLKFEPQAILLPQYGHMDFIIGSTANVDCYSKVLNFLAS